MATTIDERVVEMRFDNKQFEEGTKTTLNSLEKLKQALHLDGATKGLENVDKAANDVNLARIADGVDQLTKRFSTLGIIGMQVIQNIANGLMNTLGKGINFVENAIVSGGIKRAMNIENAHFQLQALLKDEERVQAVMQNANDSVTGTAYAYDEAAKAASQFAASGIKEGEQMMEALMGVVGVASMTNSEYEGISRIFTTVAGNGRLMGDQLLQLSSRGLNAAATIAEYFGAVNSGAVTANENVTAAIQAITKSTQVSEGDIREWVSKGKISFDIFAASMNNAFGDAAMKANTTFTGAFSNMKSALARIGAEFVSPLVAQESQVVRLFNALRVQINNVKSALTFSEQAGNVNALSKQVTDALLAMASAAADFVENADLTKPLQLFYYGVEIVKNSAKGLFSVLNPIASAFRETFLTFSMDDIVKIAEKIEEVTSKMKLTDHASKNLHDAFKGIFDIGKLFLDILLKIVGAFRPLHESTQTVSGGLLDIVGGVGRALSSFSEWIRKSETLTKIQEKLSEIITPLASKLSELAQKARDAILNFKDFKIVKDILSGLSIVIDNLRTAVGKFLERATPVGDFIVWLANGISKGGPIVVSILTKVGEAFGFIISKISEVLGKGGFNSVLDIFNAGLFLNLIKIIDDFVLKIDDFISAPSRLIKSITTLFGQLSKSLEVLQNSLKVDQLKNIATAVAILVGSMFVLSMIDSEKLSSSLGAVTVLLTELFAIVGGLSKILGDSSVKAFKSAGSMLTGLASSILILSISMKVLESIDPDKIDGALKAVSILVGEMAAVAIALSKFGGKIKTGVLGIIAFAASIFILTKSVEKLGQMDVEVVSSGLKQVGILLAELAGFMIASKFGQLKVSQALSILILAGALLVLQKSVEVFGNMDPEQLAKGIVAITGLLSAVALFELISSFSKHVLSSALSLILVAKAIEMLINPIKIFGNLDITEIAKSLGVLAGALIEIVAALRFSTGTFGGAVAILTLTAALSLLVPVMKKFGSMKWEEIGKGLATLGGALLIIGGAGALLSGFIPSIIGLAGAIALLGVAVATAGAGVFLFSVGLTTLAAGGSAAASALVVAINTILVGVIRTIGESGAELFKAAKTLIETFCEALVVTIPTIVNTVVQILDQVLDALVTYTPDIVHKLLQFVTGVLDAFSSDIPQVIQSVVNLFMAFFSGLTAALNGIDTSVLLEGVIGIGIISGLMLALSALGLLAIPAMEGVLALGATVGELTILLAALGAISQIPGLNWLIGEGGEFLGKIGESVGKLLGGFIGGAMQEASQSLPTIADNLSLFIDKVNPFIEGASKIEPSMLDGVSALANAIILLTKADIIQGISSWVTGGNSLVSFGEELAEFGPYFMAYYESIKGMDQGVVQASTNAATALAELATTLPNSGGLSGKIFGENNLSAFGEELKAFGPLLSDYASSVKDVNPDVVQASANAAKVMADIANILPNSGGLASKIFGDNTLSKFGEELESFGPHISKYAEDVKDVKTSAVEASANAVRMMADIANILPNSGGVLGFLSGDNTLSDFGKELEKFGPHIAQYAEKVENVKAESVEASANAVRMMVDLADELPNMGGLFSGESKFATFGKELVSFGESLSEYGKSITAVSWILVGTAVTEMKNLLSVAELAKGTDTSGLTNFFNSLNNVGVDGVKNFVSAFTESTGKVAGAITNFITTALNTLKGKSPQFQMEGAQSATQYLAGFKTQTPMAILTGTTFVTSILTGLKTKVVVFQTEGLAAAQKYLNSIKSQYGMANMTGFTFANHVIIGIQSTNANFLDAARTLVNMFLTAINQSNSSAQNAGFLLSNSAQRGLNSGIGNWHSIGANAAAGFVNGIRSQIAAAQAAAQELANAAPSSARSALQIHSPSRIMEKIGDYTGLGFINQLLLYVSKAGKVGKEMAESTVEGAAQGIDAFDQLQPVFIEEDLRIRPLVDLSNVEESAKKTQEMFNEAMQLSAQKANVLNASFGHWKDSKEAKEADVTSKKSDDQNEMKIFNFEQNNYSPKALPRSEIYRDTRGLFANFKEKVENL